MKHKIVVLAIAVFAAVASFLLSLNFAKNQESSANDEDYPKSPNTSESNFQNEQ